MGRIRNAAALPFTSTGDRGRWSSSLPAFIRDWAYPLAVLLVWIGATVYTASQLVSVGPSLRATPEVHRAAARKLRQPPPGVTARR